jgi:hypothetical protein
MAVQPTDGAVYAAALERAEQGHIRVRPLGGELWQATSSEPHLRGPYMLYVLDDGQSGCDCDGGRYRELCHHQAAVRAVLAGDLSWVGVEADFAPRPDVGYVYAPPPSMARRVREYDRERAGKAAAAPIEDRDYQTLFPD